MTVRHYLAVLRRRAWILLVVVLLSVGAAILLALRQDRLYMASADVWLSRLNVGTLLTGADDPNSVVAPERLLQTQARLARLPAVAKRTLAATGVDGLTPSQLLQNSNVIADPAADLLRFEVTSDDRRLAPLLATAYARQFTLYRRQLDTNALVRARAELERRLAEMRADGVQRSAPYRNLRDRREQLATLLAVQTGNAMLVRAADDTHQTQPRPLRAGFIGLGLGLVVAIALVFLAEALDTRVRSIGEAARILGLPLLGRIPEPPRRFRRKNRLVMHADPASAAAAPYRALRTSVDLAVSSAVAAGARPRTIMVTSALEREGKTTTIANLAIALARTGRHVILVDLAFGRPAVGRSFHLEPGGPGVIDAALGTVALHEALVAIDGRAGDGSRTNGARGAARGLLEVLPAGEVSPVAGELAATAAFQRLFAALRERADVILVDSPPILGAGDALALSALVDAIVVIARYPRLRRPALAELRRVLDRSPARPIGFVLTESEADVGGGDAAEVPVVHEGERRPARV